MEETIFMKFVRHEIPVDVVYEDEHTFAFLDHRPNTRGHTLVIPKKPAVNVFDIDEQSFQAVMHTVYKLAPIIRDAVGAQGVNIMSNNGSAADQKVFHLHIHIIPRFIDDGLEFNWPKEPLPQEEMEAIAGKIRAELERKSV